MNSPGLWVNRERLDLGGQLTPREIADRGRLEDGTETRPDRDPELHERASRSLVDERLGPVAADVGERSLQRTHHLRQRDLVGWPRKPVAAFDTALGRHDAGVAELREDVLEELDGNRLGGRDAVALGRPVARDRELGAGSQRVVDLRGDAHTPGIVRLRRGPCRSRQLDR
jgi:hypothetical protein